MGNSLEDWKREPTTVGAIFGIDLPYRPPKNPVGAFLWRQRFWIETTSGLSLLEPWEKLLTCAYPLFLSPQARPMSLPLWPPPIPKPAHADPPSSPLSSTPGTHTRARGRTVALLYFLLTLVFTGLFKFVPQQAPLLYRRTLYYLFGSDSSEAAAASMRRLVADWAGRNASIGDL